MYEFPKVFRTYSVQLIHVVILPVFFFIFMLVYEPFDISSLLGGEWFGVHVTILSCIILVSLALLRTLYYFLPLQQNYLLYSVWCLFEIVFKTFFTALYIWLVTFKSMSYFVVLTETFQILFLSEIFPYVILAGGIRLYDYHTRASGTDAAGTQRMRFYDSRHNLRLVVVPESVLYVAAEENYVDIFYVENGRLRNFVLRNSMKEIDELCQDNGLVRCHRSFYVNPMHIKVLRKDKDGTVSAELDFSDARRIPVTKTYYSRLSELL